MSKRFTFMFFFMILIANLFFLEKLEPSDYHSFQEKLLSLFLFQFDYFLLFIYISSKYIKYTIWPFFFLSLVYFSLFVLGLSSILITNEIEFEVFYSYVQPVLRLIIIGIFFNIGLNRIDKVSTRNRILLALGLMFGFYFLFLLFSYPRASMWSFYFYWFILVSFIIVGLLVKSPKSIIPFSLGLFFVYMSDLYYVLPPEVRTYELTYLIIRVINTIGEFLLVDFIFRHYFFVLTGDSEHN